MSSRTIDLFSDVVASLGQNIPIRATAIVSATVQKIWIDCSYWPGLWFKVGDSVTIDGTSYVIASILEDDEYITVTTSNGATLISATGTLSLRAPQFVNGTIDYATADVMALGNQVQNVTPLIYLVEPYNYSEGFDPNSSIIEESSIRLFVLDDGSESNATTATAYDNVITRMEKVFRALYSALLANSNVESKGLQEERPDGTGYVKVRFGGKEGAQLMPYQFTGCEKRFTLPIKGDCCGNIAALGECPSYSHLIEVNTDATLVTTLTNLGRNDEVTELLLAAMTQQEINDLLSQAQKNLIIPRQPLKTFQFTSYATGDDGDLEKGTGGASSILELPAGLTNSFGSTKRFTDGAGNVVFVDNVRRDHLTGLMWYYILNRPVMTWANAVADANASTLEGFDDWYLPNENELSSLKCNEGNANVFSYGGVFNGSAGFYWTSSRINGGTLAKYISYLGQHDYDALSATYYVPLCRKM